MAKKARGPKFIRYFDPVIKALNQLGGSGRPPEVFPIVAKLKNVSEAEQLEVDRKGASRFKKQVAWARQYLVWSGHLDSSRRGVWSLTEKGLATATITDEEALLLFKEQHPLHKTPQTYPSDSKAILIVGNEDDGDDTGEQSSEDYKKESLKILKRLPLQLSTDADLHEFLAKRALGPIVEALVAAGPMQRLRVTALPDAVMERLCGSLQGDPRWCARMLTGRTPDDSWKATATKLIELRNVLEIPLIVFIPPGLRTAAEDSLDVATFTELSLAGLAKDLVKSLYERLPADIQPRVKDLLDYLRTERVVLHEDQEVEYLLTVRKNGNRPEVIGQALCVFGLIPDAVLLKQSNARRRLSLNYNAADELADLARPLRERIGQLRIRPGTIQDRLFSFLRSRHTDTPRLWATEIACKEEFQDLALEHWPFEENDGQSLRLILEPLGLPIQVPDEVGGAAQMPVLDLMGKQGLKVSFRSLPRPAEVPAWKNSRIQILSYGEQGEAVVWESNNFPKPGGRYQKFSRTIKITDLQMLDEGTYYLKLDAYDQNGALLTQQRPIDPNSSEGRAENESEYFLATRGIEGRELEPPEPRVVHVASLHDAYLAASARHLSSKYDEPQPDLSTATGSWNQPVNASVRGDVTFELQGEVWAGYGVAVPGLFRKLELAILGQPRHLGVIRLDFTEVKSIADIEPELRTAAELPDLSEARSFLEARSAVFRSLHERHLARSTADQDLSVCAGTVETSDVFAVGAQIDTYAEAYAVLIDRLLGGGKAASTLPGMIGALAQMDVIELHWRRSSGDPGRAMLLSPTHPLRLLWHLRHAQFAEEAIEAAASQGEVPSWADFFKKIREEILPTNLPLVLFDSKGRGYIDQGGLTSHWSLYLPDRSEGDRKVDLAACRDRMRVLLGVRGRPLPVELVGGREIASRAIRYLQEHPYVEQLRVNVFSPGDGRVITDALREIERKQRELGVQEQTKLLRYAVQMFGTGSDQIESMGESLETLLDPDHQVAEDDEFTLSSSNHLLPKLIFARNSVDDFLQRPAEFTAHMTVFLEHFHARARLSRVDHFRCGSYVRGLVQEPEIAPDGPELSQGWSKGLHPEAVRRHGLPKPSLDQLLSCTQRLEAAAAAGQPQLDEIAPVVSLHLDAPSMALIKHAHEVSDWVITFDRNLGVEYFDSGSRSDDFGYLLDFAPESFQSDLPRIMLTTRSTAELLALTQPAFEEIGLDIDRRRASVVLEALRSLSGRLALRLLASPNESRGVIGLLLSRWLLQQAGLLDERVIIPVDAHQSWFKVKSETTEADPGLKQRADLLLVGLDAGTRTVQMTVVEVKLRESLSHGDRALLYGQMHEQGENTLRRLRERFDPDLFISPRADVLICAKELATTLAFYIRRGQRYGLLDSEQTDRALGFVEELDSGYNLEIGSVGVVFERQATGSHVDEEEPGYTVHRFGQDLARRLFLQACREFDSAQPLTESPSHPTISELPEPVEAESAPLDEVVFDSIRSSLGVRSSTRRRKAVATPGVSLNTSQPPQPAPDNHPSEPGTIQTVGANTPQSETPVPTGAVSDSSRPEDSRSPTPTTPPDDSEAPHILDPTTPPEKVPSNAPPPISAAEPSSQNQTLSVSITPGILLGASEPTSQYGVIGRQGNSTVAVDLSGCNTISLFGVQGFGKSYTMGVIAEMAAQAEPGINVLPSPLATVIFHYHKSDSYPPEFATSIAPNRKTREVDILLRDYGARPRGLTDVVLLAPEPKVAERVRQFPGIQILPIQFASGELGAESWKFLLGAYGNDALYVRHLVAIMRRHRANLTLDCFEREIREAELTNAVRRLAEDRISLARPYINDASNLGSLLRPGRTVIVDLRDEWIEKEEALGLFVVMLKIFASSRHEGKDFNKLVVFDEAHKYITESDLIGQVVETIREMRHQATSVLIASQDPLSVPRAVVELTSLLVLHRMTSPQWLKHLKGAISALDQVTEAHVASLLPGEALVWAQRATDRRFTQRPQKVTIRPRFSQHGGGTKTAVEGETVR